VIAGSASDKINQNHESEDRNLLSTVTVLVPEVDNLKRTVQ